MNLVESVKKAELLPQSEKKTKKIINLMSQHHMSRNNVTYRKPLKTDGFHTELMQKYQKGDDLDFNDTKTYSCARTVPN